MDPGLPPAKAFVAQKVATARLVGLCLVGVGLGACQEPAPLMPAQPPTTAGTERQAGAASTDRSTSAGAPATSASVPAATSASVAAAVAASAAPGAPESATVTAPAGPCTDAEWRTLLGKVGDIVSTMSLCRSGKTLTFSWRQPDGPVRAHSGGGPPPQDTPATDRRIEQALQSELSKADLQCLIDHGGQVGIGDRHSSQHSQLRALLEGRCIRKRMFHDPRLGVVVVIDGRGKVHSVRGRRHRLAPKVEACVTKTVSELVFPCLAGETMTFRGTFVD
ncbi:MAG: hypothetical protein JRI68_28235 [Deltaproteobacteria bacterium]|nr:hypothetical protein [Deltaproteobacteria bacterium]